MYCKECGTKINESDKFCPSCGNISEVSTASSKSNISVEEKTDANAITTDSFYCTYCGENIGSAKRCTKCRTKAIQNKKTYCRYCGGLIERKRCISCHTSYGNNIVESTLRFFSIVLIGISFFGALVDLLTQKNLLIVQIEFFIPLILCIFVVRKKQIFKIKKLLLKKKLKPLLIILVYILVSVIVICGIGLASIISDENKTCIHSYGEWHKETPCNTLEWRKCKYCDNKDFRVVEADHKTNNNGICVNCGTKIIYSEEEIKNIIQIQFFDLGEYDGGALKEIKIVFKNTSQKEINEIFFGVTGYYNGEKDVYRCTYPANVLPGVVVGNDHYYEPLWPSEGMYGVKISSINITYTDGTQERIFDDNVELAFWQSFGEDFDN